MKYILIALILLSGEALSQSNPKGYTPWNRFRVYSQGANPGADSLNANYRLADSLHNIQFKRLNLDSTRYLTIKYDSAFVFGLRHPVYLDSTHLSSDTLTALVARDLFLTLGDTTEYNPVIPLKHDQYRMDSLENKLAGFDTLNGEWVLVPRQGFDSANVYLIVDSLGIRMGATEVDVSKNGDSLAIHRNELNAAADSFSIKLSTVVFQDYRAGLDDTLTYTFGQLTILSDSIALMVEKTEFYDTTTVYRNALYVTTDSIGLYSARFNSADSLVSFINLKPGSIDISSDKIDIYGIVKFINGNSDSTIINGGKIQTGSIVSASWGVDEGSQFDLDNGTIKLGGSESYRFYVDETGQMTATDGFFAGTVTASTISGSQIQAGTALIGDNVNSTLDGIYMNAYNYWYDNGGFRVGESNDGISYSVGQDIVYLGSKTILLGTMQRGSGESVFKADDSGIYLGNTTFANAEFRVTPEGALTATSATITGDISSGSTITGSTITSTTFIGDTISGSHITGATINGATITGGTIQTDTSGQRVVLSNTTNAISIYDATGSVGSLSGFGSYIYASNNFRVGGHISLFDGSTGYHTITGSAYGIEFNNSLKPSGYLSSDGTAGATTTTGGATFKNGLYVSGSITAGAPSDTASYSDSTGTLKTGTYNYHSNAAVILNADFATSSTYAANLYNAGADTFYTADDFVLIDSIGYNVQGYDADLTTYAGITPSANVQTLLGSANYAAFKTSLGIETTDVTGLGTLATVDNNFTANMVIVSNGAAELSVSSVSTTTLGYLDATSSIQTQLNGKAATFTGLTTTFDVKGADNNNWTFTIVNGIITDISEP